MRVSEEEQIPIEPEPLDPEPLPTAATVEYYDSPDDEYYPLDGSLTELAESISSSSSVS